MCIYEVTISSMY